MTVTAPESPTAPSSAAVLLTGALVMEHVAARESIIERALRLILEALLLWRTGAADRSETFTRVREAAEDASLAMREETDAYYAAILEVYGEDYAPVLTDDPEDALDEDYWDDLADQFSDDLSYEDDLANDGEFDRPVPRDSVDRDSALDEAIADFAEAVGDDPSTAEVELIDLTSRPNDARLRAAFDAMYEEVEMYLRAAVVEAEEEARPPAGAQVGKVVVIGYRRIIHPEKSKGGVCGLCVAAADRWYTRKNLKPLHDRCKCDVLPITTESDPGFDLNSADLAAAYGAAHTTDGYALKQVRFKGSPGELETVRERKRARGPAKARRDRGKNR